MPSVGNANCSPDDPLPVGVRSDVVISIGQGFMDVGHRAPQT
jgi:hypothetical protein